MFEASFIVKVHTNKLIIVITGIGCKRLRSIKFKAPVTSSEPQIVLVSVHEGILSTNTFFFLDEELITNDDAEG